MDAGRADETALDARRLAERIVTDGYRALEGEDVFEAHGAAALLGIAHSSLNAAAYRKRVSWVEYRGRRYYTRHDLVAYMRARGPRRESKLSPMPTYLVWGGQVVVDDPERPKVDRGDGSLPAHR